MGLSRLHFTRVALTGLVSNLPNGISSANSRVGSSGSGIRVRGAAQRWHKFYIYIGIPAVENESLLARASFWAQRNISDIITAYKKACASYQSRHEDFGF